MLRKTEVLILTHYLKTHLYQTFFLYILPYCNNFLTNLDHIYTHNLFSLYISRFPLSINDFDKRRNTNTCKMNPLYRQELLEVSYAMGDLAFYPGNPDRIYLATGDPQISSFPKIGNGVYRSLDAGESWQNMGLDSMGVISKLLFASHFRLRS